MSHSGQDNMGLNETNGRKYIVLVHVGNVGLNGCTEDTGSSKGPRGIRGYKLDVGNFSEWKVQGKIGGYTG